jgi:hypothetical protein
MMTEQEKKEFQSLKERVAYLEGILVTLQGQKGIPTVYPTVSPNTFWYGPYPKYEVTS